MSPESKNLDSIPKCFLKFFIYSEVYFRKERFPKLGLPSTYLYRRQTLCFKKMVFKNSLVCFEKLLFVCPFVLKPLPKKKQKMRKGKQNRPERPEDCPSLPHQQEKKSSSKDISINSLLTTEIVYLFFIDHKLVVTYQFFEYPHLTPVKYKTVFLFFI